MKKTKKIVLAGIFVAMIVILSRFLSIKLPGYKIGFSYIPIYLSGILLGPMYTAIVGGLADLIGSTLFPFGSYFVGYTISATLNGAIYGWMLHKRFKQDISDKEFLIRLTIATLISKLVVNGVLNTIWIAITQDKAFFVIVGARMIKELIMIPIQIISIFALEKALRPAIFKFLKGDD
ncbi:MAG: folate family ECF transporter S component [Clostridia bacterium]|jgi:ECF transporter S component (folate family)|nr:folate family ECF transporter S component [Clostridia bacterium]